MHLPQVCTGETSINLSVSESTPGPTNCSEDQDLLLILFLFGFIRVYAFFKLMKNLSAVLGKE